MLLLYWLSRFTRELRCFLNFVKSLGSLASFVLFSSCDISIIALRCVFYHGAYVSLEICKSSWAHICLAYWQNFPRFPSNRFYFHENHALSHFSKIPERIWNSLYILVYLYIFSMYYNIFGFSELKFVFTTE